MRSVRDKYPCLMQGIFLNHAATSPVSLPTMRRVKDLVDQMGEPLGKHFYTWLGIVETCRRRIAELIDAEPGEIAFTTNTSSAISLITLGLPWEKGDRVLVPSNEFPSNIYPWQNLKVKGVICSTFDPIPGEPIVETLLRQNLEKVRLISISAVSYQTGRLYELEAFTQFCRERGILSCLDAIQAIGTLPFSAHALGVDFIAGGAQKWLLGPIGCGFLYLRKELLEKMFVPFVGWGSVQYPERFDPDLQFSSEMTRYEPGLLNILPIAGLEQSMKDLEAVGWKKIFEKILSKSEKIEDELLAKGLKSLKGKGDLLSGISSFYLPKGVDKLSLEKRLSEHKITITLRDDYLRISPHFYSSDEEIEKTIEVITGIVPLKSPLSLSKKEETKTVSNPKILLTGVTGTLGIEIAKLLIEQGYDLFLLGRGEALEKARTTLEALSSRGVEVYNIDLSKENEITSFIQFAESSELKFKGLIHSAVIAEGLPFELISRENLQSHLDVNLLAPALLTQGFLKKLRVDEEVGILNLLPISARCGFPLLSAYGSSSSAWWTLSETIRREEGEKGVWVTNFIAPSMHSKLQKRLGRIALRYFKLSGVFDYDHPQEVAKRALKAFFKKQTTVYPKGGKLLLFLNLFWPSKIDNRLKKIWRK